MNVNPDGSVGIDLAALTTELSGLRQHGNGEEAKRIAQRIQIEALLDIAVSLRTLATESAYAMEPQRFELGADKEDLEGVPSSTDLVVGDLVHVIDEEPVGQVLDVGIDQGDLWASVGFTDGTETEVTRYWQRNLVRLAGDEGDAPDPLAEVIVEPPVIVAEGMADELDDEFESDDFTQSQSALEALRNLEKPAAKKAATKKGKKS